MDPATSLGIFSHAMLRFGSRVECQKIRNQKFNRKDDADGCSPAWSFLIDVVTSKMAQVSKDAKKQEELPAWLMTAIICLKRQRHCMSHSPGKMNRKFKKNSLCFGCHLCAKPKIGSSTSQVCRSSFCFLYLAWLQKSHLKSQISKEVCRSSEGLLRPSSKVELRHACPTKMQPSWISTICDG